MKKVVIIGAGGHAKVIIDILQRNKEYELVGCTATNIGEDVLGLQVLGDDSILSQLYQQGIQYAFVAVGDNKLRKKLAVNVKKMGFQLINVISSFSYSADSVRMGEGIAIMPGAILNAEVVVNNYAVVNTGASIDHECTLGEAVHIAPGCNLSGNVRVEEGAFLGTGTIVIDGITIGSWSVLGSGSVVVKNFPDQCVGVGVPAKIINEIKK